MTIRYPDFGSTVRARKRASTNNAKTRPQTTSMRSQRSAHLDTVRYGFSGDTVATLPHITADTTMRGGGKQQKMATYTPPATSYYFSVHQNTRHRPLSPHMFGGEDDDDDDDDFGDDGGGDGGGGDDGRGDDDHFGDGARGGELFEPNQQSSAPNQKAQTTRSRGGGGGGGGGSGRAGAAMSRPFARTTRPHTAGLLVANEGGVRSVPPSSSGWLAGFLNEQVRGAAVAVSVSFSLLLYFYTFTSSSHSFFFHHLLFMRLASP
jgi:hypothetical protein